MATESSSASAASAASAASSAPIKTPPTRIVHYQGNTKSYLFGLDARTTHLKFDDVKACGTYLKVIKNQLYVFNSDSVLRTFMIGYLEIFEAHTSYIVIGLGDTRFLVELDTTNDIILISFSSIHFGYETVEVWLDRELIFQLPGTEQPKFAQLAFINDIRSQNDNTIVEISCCTTDGKYATADCTFQGATDSVIIYPHWVEAMFQGKIVTYYFEVVDGGKVISATIE